MLLRILAEFAKIQGQGLREKSARTNLQIYASMIFGFVALQIFEGSGVSAAWSAGPQSSTVGHLVDMPMPISIA